ncbi:hypothetical protein K9M48_01960 [Candidatus Gracilibacteria bacterium]|nr:hypothetical protein [Candidatus Gracilibacteria bacterium]
MEKFILIIAIAGITFIALRIRHHYKQQNRELLDNFLEILSSSFHEGKWKLLETTDVFSYSDEKIKDSLISIIKKDTSHFLRELISKMESFPRGGFRYYTGDPGTNTFVARAYNLIKEHHLRIYSLSKKERIENLDKLCDDFYDALQKIILDIQQNGDLIKNT